jgi:hypothetical protein
MKKSQWLPRRGADFRPVRWEEESERKKRLQCFRSTRRGKIGGTKGARQSITNQKAGLLL